MTPNTDIPTAAKSAVIQLQGPPGDPRPARPGRRRQGPHPHRLRARRGQTAGGVRAAGPAALRARRSEGYDAFVAALDAPRGRTPTCGLCFRPPPPGTRERAGGGEDGRAGRRTTRRGHCGRATNSPPLRQRGAGVGRLAPQAGAAKPIGRLPPAPTSRAPATCSKSRAISVWRPGRVTRTEARGRSAGTPRTRSPSWCWREPLAVDAGHQGRGLGRGLLRDAVLRTAAAAEVAGVRALLVHALSGRAAAFYGRAGFRPSRSTL